ncbi:hypothetical protein PBY51_016410 [Eleginops maclovinus]|uniref:Uncharacterized protein n=1 Tax=Eleginops maclovinus TaxID=56733 RepID=A0AAN7XJL8_ELEMC|nr:hypothetical protein PBY51_016410 [Eleginops maclovinus]
MTSFEKALAEERSRTVFFEKALAEERSRTTSFETALAEERSASAPFEKALVKEKSATAALEKELLRKRADKAALYKSLHQRTVIISDLQAVLAKEQYNSSKVQLKVQTLTSELKSCRKDKEQLKKNLARSDRKLQEQVKKEENKKLAQEDNKNIGTYQDHLIELHKTLLNENASKVKIQNLEDEGRRKDRQLLSLQAKIDRIDDAEAQKRAEEESIWIRKVHMLRETIRDNDEFLAVNNHVIN